MSNIARLPDNSQKIGIRMDTDNEVQTAPLVPPFTVESWILCPQQFAGVFQH